jgi:S1-C subfamily serine protease
MEEPLYGWRPYRTGMAACVLSLVLLTCMEGTAFCGWSLSRIAGQYRPSVVRVVALDGQDRVLAEGEGFFLDGSGRVATAFHLTRKARRVVVETSAGVRGEFLDVVGADPIRDLLIARTTLKETPDLTLGDSRGVYPGADVLVLGISPGGEAMLSPGTVAAIHRLDEMHLIHMTAPILPGWSGAPVFDLSGEVIGVAVAFLAQGEDLNFAVPAHYLMEMQPVSLDLHELPERTTRIEASLREETLVELRLSQARGTARPPRRGVEFKGGTGSPCDAVRMGAGYVHFRNGRRLLVEKAWREGDRVFLVMPAKGFAVSYDACEIGWFEPLPHLAPGVRESFGPR